MALIARGRWARALLLSTLALAAGCDDMPEVPDTSELPDIPDVPRLSELGELVGIEPEEPLVYFYEGDRGQRVFTNDLDLVPREKRLTIQRMDLSHISLNEELGAEINARIEEEHERLSETEPCVEAREESEAGLIQHTLRRYPHLWGFGAVILGLLLFSPFIARRVGGAMWFRTMVFLIPILCSLALLTHGLREGTESMRAMRETANLCDPNAPGAESPALRMQMVQALHNRYEGVDTGGQAEIEQVLQMGDQNSN